jgi:hypothetical protein
MWLLLLPLIIAEIAFWLFLLYGVWRFYRTWTESRPAVGALWLVVLALPFAVFWAGRSSADAREVLRASDVASLVRQSMPETYPRLLEIHGFVTTQELLLFLDALAIDEIVMFQSRQRRGVQNGQQFTLAEDCRGRGREHLMRLAETGHLKNAAAGEDRCLKERKVTLDADRRTLPAILFLIGDMTTLKLPGNGWSAGNYEARMRTADADTLLDYWERPYIPRPAGPSPWGHAFPANTDWKTYRNPGRALFFATAAGLIPRRGAR